MANCNKAASVVMALGLIAVGMTAKSVSAQPALSMRQEAAAHPRVVKAIRDTEGALKALEAAPDDFGGNKIKAIEDLRAAVHSMRKALFFRLKMDDAAIDGAQF